MAQKIELNENKMVPLRKTLFRPMISAIFPKGTIKTADDNRNDMATQLIITAWSPKWEPIAGKARLMDDPIKGFANEVISISVRIKLRCRVGSSFSLMTKVLIKLQALSQWFTLSYSLYL